MADDKMIDKETEKDETEETTQREPLSKFTKTVIIEVAVLAVVLLVSRAWIFPPMARVGEMHAIIALNIFLTGMTATLFALFAITFRRAWKTHGKYVLLPIIFTVFGFLMQMIVEEINF